MEATKLVFIFNFSQKAETVEQKLNFIWYRSGLLDLKSLHFRIYDKSFLRTRNKFYYLRLFQQSYIWFSQNRKRFSGKASKRTEIQFPKNYHQKISSTNISHPCMSPRANRGWRRMYYTIFEENGSSTLIFSNETDERIKQKKIYPERISHEIIKDERFSTPWSGITYAHAFSFFDEMIEFKLIQNHGNLFHPDFVNSKKTQNHGLGEFSKHSYIGYKSSKNSICPCFFNNVAHLQKIRKNYKIFLAHYVRVLLFCSAWQVWKHMKFMRFWWKKYGWLSSTQWW